MQRSSAIAFRCSLCLIILFVAACSDEPASTAPASGYIAVSIVDPSLQIPVPDVAVTLAAADVTVLTGPDGIARFTLAPGDYTLRAAVCCVGPGFIQYEVPTTVAAGETSEVVFNACLACE
jgi:hypothetical protein